MKKKIKKKNSFGFKNNKAAGKAGKKAAKQIIKNFELKDSGKRQEFSTGAIRDTSEGKGRYDLISPIAIRRLAIVLEKGAEKYSERNWEQGMNLCRYIDSAKRHLDQLLSGEIDEDHAAQAMFNIMAFIHTKYMIDIGKLPKELNDLPDYT